MPWPEDPATAQWPGQGGQPGPLLSPWVRRAPRAAGTQSDHSLPGLLLSCTSPPSVLLPRTLPSLECRSLHIPLSAFNCPSSPTCRSPPQKRFSDFPSTDPALTLRSPVILCAAAPTPLTYSSLMQWIPFYIALWLFMWSDFPLELSAPSSLQLHEPGPTTSWVPGNVQGALTTEGHLTLQPGVHVPVREEKSSTAWSTTLHGQAQCSFCSYSPECGLVPDGWK